MPTRCEGRWQRRSQVCVRLLWGIRQLVGLNLGGGLPAPPAACDTNSPPWNRLLQASLLDGPPCLMPMAGRSSQCAPAASPLRLRSSLSLGMLAPCSGPDACQRAACRRCMSIGWNPVFGNKEKTAEPWILHDFGPGRSGMIDDRLEAGCLAGPLPLSGMPCASCHPRCRRAADNGDLCFAPADANFCGEEIRLIVCAYIRPEARTVTCLPACCSCRHVCLLAQLQRLPPWRLSPTALALRPRRPTLRACRR